MELRQILLLSTAWIIHSYGGPSFLPSLVIPKHYSIHLTIPPNFYQTKRFTGTVEIAVTVHRPTNYIILDSSGIKYTNSVIIIDTKEERKIPVILADGYLGTIILTTHEQLERKEYILRFPDYEGIIREDMYGLYRSSYTNDNNETEYLLATQFQAVYASRVFPCFDEPKYKTVFSLKVTRPEEYVVLSNTLSVEDDGINVRFAETPLMSTYTLALVVSKFRGYSSSQHLYLRMPLDVWCRVEALPTAQYAFEMTVELLSKFSDFTGIDYYQNIKKLDLVAIPDLGPSAMENWGLLTFRESTLLWDEAESTQYMKQNILFTIAHELAHIWFGNLVTFNSWSYTWLHEGFATYYQYRLSAEVEPDWEIEKQFVVEGHLPVMDTDTYDGAPALNDPADSPSEIDKKFSIVAYKKGACIVKMLINFMGEDRFNSGIRQYLKEYSYRNIEPAHLYNSLSKFIEWEEEDDPDELEDVMFTWTENPGYPLVTVHRNRSGFTLTQERFLLTSKRSPYKWFVPITYTTAEHPNFTDTTVSAWLHPDGDLFIPNEESKGWVVVNLLATGFYRVNYDEPLWQALAKALNAKNFTEVFPEVNRALIVDDAMNLARVDAISYKTALSVISFLEKDTSYYPWSAAFGVFHDLIAHFDNSRVGKTLREHLLKLMSNLRKSVTFDVHAMTNQLSILTAMLTLEWACMLEEKSCIDESDRFFNDYISGKRIDPNIRSIVYCSAIRQDQTGERWRFLWEKYQETKLESEGELILSALGCSKNETILEEYLSLSLNTSPRFRKLNFQTLLKAVLVGNPSNYRVAFDFLKENIESIALLEGPSSLTNIVSVFAGLLTTEQEISEYDAILMENREEIEATNDGVGLSELAKRNLQWIESNTGEIESWLREKDDSASVMVTVTSVLIWSSLVAAGVLSF